MTMRRPQPLQFTRADCERMYADFHARTEEPLREALSIAEARYSPAKAGYTPFADGLAPDHLRTEEAWAEAAPTKQARDAYRRYAAITQNAKLFTDTLERLKDPSASIAVTMTMLSRAMAQLDMIGKHLDREREPYLIEQLHLCGMDMVAEVAGHDTSLRDESVPPRR